MGIIGLPDNLFYGTGIAACILVIDKGSAHARTGIFMIDSSNGFLKDGNKNRLRAQDIRKIVDVFNERVDLPRYSRMVPLSEISSSENYFNLNIPRYINSSEPLEVHDLGAHLNGGIPNRDIDALAHYWRAFPSLRQALFSRNDRPMYSEAIVDASMLHTVICHHDEFISYRRSVMDVFAAWCKQHKQQLRGIRIGSQPKEIINALSADLLTRFSPFTLVDAYDVYQKLLEYWDQAMQDDVYLIATDGWSKAAKPRIIVEEGQGRWMDTADLIVKRKKYKMDLIPPDLIVERYFVPEQTAISELEAKRESAVRSRSEFIERYLMESGLLGNVGSGIGTTTTSRMKARIRDISGQVENDKERGTLTRCLALIEAEEKMTKAANAGKAMLDQKALSQYALLTDSEIKTLVIEDKWFAEIGAAIDHLVEDLAVSMTQQIRDIMERYGQALSAIEQEVEVLTFKVKNNLKELALHQAEEFDVNS